MSESKIESMSAAQRTAEPGWSFWIAPACLICLLSLLYLPLEWIAKEKSDRTHSESLVRELSSFRGRIERTVFEETARIHGIAAVIRANPDITQQDFASIASGIVGGEHLMHNIAAARDLVITHMYPIEGNEKAIGFSYRDNEAQWPAVKNAVDKNALVIAGPVDLVQGGAGFIARIPIFLSNQPGMQADERSKLWGVLSSVIEVDEVLSLAQPFEKRGMEIALRGKDALGAEGAVFYGDPELFNYAKEVMTISLPYGSWEAGARFVTPLIGNSLEIWLLRAAILLGCSATFLIFSFRYRSLLKEIDAAKRNEQSESKYQALFDGARDAIFITDPAMQTIRECNEIAAKRLGYERHELLGKPITHIDENADLVARALSERLRTECSALEQIESVHLKKDGGLMPVEITRSLVNFDGADLVLSIARDVTERKKQEHQLKVAQEHAEAANLAKSAFLANMSHEIRTPMNGVLAMSELLLDDNLTERQRKKAEVIHRSGNVLMVILNDVLDLSKIEAGQVVLEEIEFDLSDILQSVVDFSGGVIGQKDLRFSVESDDLSYPRLIGDPTRILQILTNLINNAVKFTDEGTITLTVSQTNKADSTVMTYFEVADTGIGMREDVLDRMFERFSQADTSTTRKYGGTGLGLSICRNLVELMGGSINGESESGAGSRFWFTVPATPGTSEARQRSTRG